MPDDVRHFARPASMLLLALLSGCEDSHVVACFGDADFCAQVITANIPPEADAGADQEVAAGDPVSLDGSASTDLDGRIASYSWTQIAGRAVALRNAALPVAGFDAPAVAIPETLTFRLTVVDDDQAATADDVSVEVVPAVAFAASAGFALLSRAVVPGPVLASETCRRPPLSPSAWFALAGLWIAAHTVVLADAPAPDEVSRFLDAARVLLAHAAMQPLPSDATAGVLWTEGLQSLARFTEDRDPALAEWAEDGLPATLSESILHGVRTGTLSLSLAGGVLARKSMDPSQARAEAVDFLRQVDCGNGLDPIRLAADTVLLLGAPLTRSPSAN